MATAQLRHRILNVTREGRKQACHGVRVDTDSTGEENQVLKASIAAPLTTEISGGECGVVFAKPSWLARPAVLNVAGLLTAEDGRVDLCVELPGTTGKNIV